MPVDDSYTKALLHMDGANGSTTFTDESGKIWTVGRTAQLSTAQYKFAPSSGIFASDAYIVATDAQLTVGTAAFTLDGWIRPTALGTGFYSIFETRAADNAAGVWLGLINKNLCVYYNGGTRITGTTTVADDTWYHVAIVGNGAGSGSRSIKIYLDGNLEGSEYVVDYNFTSSQCIVATTWAANLGFNGWIDEFRFSNGIARWTAPFTPPTAPYAPAAADSLIYGATLLTEILPASAGKASGALLLSEINPASFGKISGAMLLVEITDSPNPFGIIATTLASRSTAATLRTKRKTYATLNERSTTLTLEERP